MEGGDEAVPEEVGEGPEREAGQLVGGKV